jgi:alkylation response protein AidB-like acyl-CoA dehydrogenase
LVFDALRFDPVDLPEAAELRAEVRDFLAGFDFSTDVRVRSWSGSDTDFSRALGARGWIGVTWPKVYGGHERSALERYVLLEELLAAGAPVGAHWIADRQSGPLLLRYGTEVQKRSILPLVARGELYFCIGMSEPGAGSDLASVKTAATRTSTGWRINGQKVWTTNAHLSHRMIALVRTSSGESRHQGLSQFLIDLSAPGVTVRPIVDLAGDHHFNEVFLEDVDVEDDALIGQEGDGWRQVTAELSLERSGPERYLSSFHLFRLMIDAAGTDRDPALRSEIGKAIAELWTLRRMSLSVAAALARGEDPALEATIVKDLGNSFEQRLPRVVQAVASTNVNLIGADAMNRALALYLQISPSFSLRGGTREILRGIIARGMGLR